MKLMTALGVLSINRNELKQLRFLNKEIYNYKTMLLSLENKEDMKILKLEIEKKLEMCFKEYRKLNNFIDSIDDSEMRLIISLRYINNLTWQQVAFHIGYSDESTPRKRFDRFLKKRG